MRLSELTSPGLDGQRSPAELGPTYWLDVTEIVSYARGGNNVVAGIQRVNANLVLQARRERVRIVPAIPDLARSTLLEPDRRAVERLVEMMQSGASADEIRAEVDTVDATCRAAEPRAGDVVVLPGAFWMFAHFELMVELRRKGIRNAILIHDLIQLNNPELVPPDAPRIFCERFVDMVGIADILLANSEFVARDVQKFAKRSLNHDLSITPVKLATAIPPDGAAQPILPAILELAQRPFVLCVGVIEIRKNHKLLLDVWERLVAERGGDVPTLVFVGKWGWMVEDLRARIDASGALGRWLRIENGLSDAELGYLYRHCLFTIYPSLAEGWGLPVGESLAYGAPCIASNATSLPEVGGDLARYFDPLDPDEAYRVVSSTLADPAELAAWRARVRREFTPRSWSEFSGEFYGAIATGLAALPPHPPHLNYVLPSGQLLPAGNRDLEKKFQSGRSLLTFRMARLSGWRPPDDEGLWTEANTASLRFPSNLEPASAILVHLRLRASAEAETSPVSVEVGGVRHDLGLLDRAAHFVTAEGIVSPDGSVEITISSNPARSRPGDATARPIQLVCLAYVARANALARLDMLEKIAVETSRGVAALNTFEPVRKPGPDEIIGPAFVLRFLIQGGKRARPRDPLVRMASALLLGLARAYARRRRLGAAERAYRRLLAVHPNQPKQWVQYGHVLKDRGDLPAAAGAYRTAFALTPEDEDARLQYRLALERLGFPEEARDVLSGVHRALDESGT